MTTQTETEHVERCLALAELRLTKEQRAESLRRVVPKAEVFDLAMGFDPRFAALRGEHEYFWLSNHGGPSIRTCPHCSDVDSTFSSPYCLRTDAGSLLRAAAACGLAVRKLLVDSGPRGWVCALQGHFWDVTMWQMTGDTPEAALSAALTQAVIG